jgi:hypothetical protein
MSSLEKELSILLDWLCRKWGFCIPPADNLRISKSKHFEAGQFAIEVLRAEGFETPEYELEWTQRIRERFIEHFGRAVVSEDDYEG